MKISVIRSSWMPGYGHRLDCKPYLSGALETRSLLEKLPFRKDPLRTLTTGYDGGIYHGPRFMRTYVDSPEDGVPFLGSSSMLYADLSGLRLLSRRQAEGTSLRHLEIRQGMTLISCSGTIGKMVYARPDMAGMWSSQHIMKVVPDPAKVPPGYLYAFLSSEFGVPLVVSGTYGSIIESLEPGPLAKLQVPRIGNALEDEIDSLVVAAAELRTKARQRKCDATDAFVKLCGLPELIPAHKYPTPHIGSATSAELAERMDSTYYIPPCSDARSAFDGLGRDWQSKSLGEISNVFVPTIFKRLYADDATQGYPYLTGADVFCIKPNSTQYLMRKVAHENKLLLETGMILVHEAGQRYGLIGRSVMVGKTLNGFSCTNNMVRLVPHDNTEAGYIFAALSSEHGVRLLKREAAGSSIPHLDDGRISAVEIPWPERGIRTQVAALAHEALESWDQADELEMQAESKLVGALRGAAN